VSECISFLSLLGKCPVNCIPLFIATQRLVKHVPAAMITRRNRKIVSRVSLWICLYIPLWLLGNNSVKTFPRQRRIFESIVFCQVRVVLKESRRLVFLITFVYR
jgi:hypothetical protein